MCLDSHGKGPKLECFRPLLRAAVHRRKTCATTSDFAAGS